MELTLKPIPEQFVRNVPQGMRLLQRPEGRILLVEALFCPNGHNLLVDSVRIHGEPSIRIEIAVRDQTGTAFLDSIWGSHANLFTFLATRIEPGDAVAALCPYCRASLMIDAPCGAAGCAHRQQIVFYLPGRRNHIVVCPKLGCPHHELVVDDLAANLLQVISEINYFGAGLDDVFGGI